MSIAAWNVTPSLPRSKKIEKRKSSTGCVTAVKRQKSMMNEKVFQLEVMLISMKLSHLQRKIHHSLIWYIKNRPIIKLNGPFNLRPAGEPDSHCSK